MTSKPRQMHFGVSLGDSGVHPAAWRLPSNGLGPVPSLDHFVNLAQTAERGLFDMVFTADNVFMDTSKIERQQPWREFEPLTMMAALSVLTSKVGLVSTTSTTFSEPYNVARAFASLDHLSGGRAGWNIVTSHVGAENFGMDGIPTHEFRYGRAEEFVEIVARLWDSWEADAKILDRENGIYADPSKIHEINYIGEHFKVKGPLNISRTPQGHPVMVQAGSSGYGKALGAKYAEVIFTAQSELREAMAFYQEMHDLVTAAGRDHTQLRILPGISPIVGRTEAEAREKFAAMTELLDRDTVLRLVGQSLHTDLSEYDLDDTVPESVLPSIAEVEGHQSRFTIYRAWAVDDKRTIRQMAQEASASQGHWLVVGTPEHVVDVMVERFENFAADGFNIVPSAMPQTLDDFVDLVVPVLQERGLYRTEYEGDTLRDHLELEIPVSAHVSV
ncbi:LLM class flavin-dependent oxidoreductase [Glaciihabitans sp. dw_435]|uniref:LLM class flavin-dependent oxidoreductase n=1 Tax=Glaciihabitans sp. dw_435 TaxID=2720081 RepID=UPI001BD4EBFE|nr:LLM class flavin-dependent oxidoreductase [Glaciihabitans sp. dw_435]